MQVHYDTFKSPAGEILTASFLIRAPPNPDETFRAALGILDSVQPVSSAQSAGGSNQYVLDLFSIIKWGLYGRQLNLFAVMDKGSGEACMRVIAPINGDAERASADLDAKVAELSGAFEVLESDATKLHPSLPCY